MLEERESRVDARKLVDKIDSLVEKIDDLNSQNKTICAYLLGDLHDYNNPGLIQRVNDLEKKTLAHYKNHWKWTGIIVGIFTSIIGIFSKTLK